jgi:hypothetical protein
VVLIWRELEEWKGAPVVEFGTRCGLGDTGIERLSPEGTGISKIPLLVDKTREKWGT